MSEGSLVETLLDWYDANARDLPWRSPKTSPWGVMVSEFMLQQTPVARVLTPYQAWLERWPTPTDLAASPTGDAVRMWGKLGYPRRALRLHAAATEIRDRHDGDVPADWQELRELPGVGDYTASAILAFGFGQRQVVLDTNVRRVYARARTGKEFPSEGSPTRSERAAAEAELPAEAPDAATFSVAIMELGAVICTAAKPKCAHCPITELCHWRALDYPAYAGPPRRGQSYAGTDRQCRGRILDLLRASETSVPQSAIDVVWQPAEQRIRCLQSLLDDGLAVRTNQGYALPG